MALKEFHLPDIGEGIAEGEIVKWLVTEGQEVKEEQPFVEVMTDKATVTITVPHDGVIKELRAKAGQVVPVESVIAVLDVGAKGGAPQAGSAAPQAPAQKAPAPAAPQRQPITPAAKAPQPQPQPQAQTQLRAQPQPAARPQQTGGAGRPAAAPQRAAATPVATEEPRARMQPAPAAEAAPASPGRVLAAPATRRRARELGVDLGEVQATGPRGRVTNDDLNAFLSGGAAVSEEPDAASAEPEEAVSSPPAAAAAPARVTAAPQARPAPAPAAARGRGPEERVPMRGLRKKIAEAMTRSKHTAAHFTYVDDLDVTELVKLRARAKELYAPAGVNVTYLPFIMKAVVEAHRKFPFMNCSLDEATQELVVKHYYNFGIATDTDNGLIVPVLKGVDQKSIAQLAKEIQELSERTRAGKVAIEDLRDGTFSITNAGNIGGLFATPVINFPEVAILGVHAIKKTPRVRDGEIVVADVMYLSVSIDHRIVDGATGARWMNVVKDCLENPTRLLLGSV